MKISLMVLSAGTAAGKALPINAAQFIIGRDPQCNLRPASAMISKRHCAVIVKNDQVFLRDFDSSNGTFVNDERIKGEVQLKNGDVLKVGPLSFKVQIEEERAPTKKEPVAKPAPLQALPDISDDDAAAMLSLEEDGEGNVRVGSSETAEDAVPSNTTQIEIPAFVSADDAAAEKPEEKKPVAKKPVGSAQNAAQSIFDKLRQGKRK